MKTINNAKWLLVIFFVALTTLSVSAQTKADVFDKNVPLTWLGVDYSLTKFIGSPTKGIASNNGVVDNDEFRQLYTAQWNQLFIDQAKKYDVAAATHRTSVKYAIDVAIKADQALTQKDFFSNNPTDFKTINETAIADAVKKYDFQNNSGLGMIFFVEGMSKGFESMGIWVTFVDIKSKTVLYTTYQTGKPGGFGFRNYWAKPLYTVIKDMESNFNKWK